MTSDQRGGRWPLSAARRVSPAGIGRAVAPPANRPSRLIPGRLTLDRPIGRVRRAPAARSGSRRRERVTCLFSTIFRPLRTFSNDPLAAESRANVLCDRVTFVRRYYESVNDGPPGELAVRM